MTEPLSTRRDGDTWDLASGVGATATAVATSRALAHRLRVIDDPWAEPLVRAVGNDHFLGLLDSPAAQADQHRLTLGMAVRTRYFDEFMLAAADAGIRQMVILATGLDTRGYRLNWPAGTTVFDLDQPAVVEFKATTLTALGSARPRRFAPSVWIYATTGPRHWRTTVSTRPPRPRGSPRVC